jgi:Holliday junction resolvasome RuvABC endonuclease subunit|nr:MAG TPA: RuvC [Caudoviricetes sp.]
MYIYGLDPSLKNSGIVIIDKDTKEVVYVGGIRTDNIKDYKNLPEEMRNPKKLRFIYEELIKLTRKYPPSVAVIERGFTRFNKSTQVVFRVHGIFNLVFSEVDNIYYPAKTIRETLYKGNASKEEVADILSKHLNITFNSDDESDAMAVAYAYLVKNGLEWIKPKAYTKKEIEALKKPKKGTKKKATGTKKTIVKEAKVPKEFDVDKMFKDLENIAKKREN